MNGIERLAQLIRNKRTLHLALKNPQNAKSERKGKMAEGVWIDMRYELAVALNGSPLGNWRAIH